jgi:formylglycine-generating enzyme required for sulfatase activity
MPISPPPTIWPLNDYEARLPHHTLLWVDGGAFTMGSNDEDAFDDEKHLRDVTVPSFCMARFPVIQALYVAVMEVENPSAFPGNDRPVEQVSWEDAKAFVQKLNEKTGRTHAQWQYALPSEAQWEYAARGGKSKQNTKYAGSDKLKEVGWFETNSHDETKPVGLKQPNALGLYDMSGNVWEWCEDDWHDSYEHGPKDGSAWVDTPERGLFRVRRGGTWDRNPRRCRATCRYFWLPYDRFNSIGFRLCLVFREVGVRTGI